MLGWDFSCDEIFTLNKEVLRMQTTGTDIYIAEDGSNANVQLDCSTEGRIEEKGGEKLFIIRN